MAKIIDVAQFIYDELGWVNAWRLEKLAYYADSWFAAWYGDPLFDEHFEAWVDGPVAPVLYRANKGRDGLVSPNLPDGDGSALLPREVAAVSSVLDFYGSWTKEQLIEQTHQEEPWIEARKGLGKHARSNNVISKETTMRFYARCEAAGRQVPMRPFDGRPKWDAEDVRATFEANSARWADAIELLADR
mgnify:CR=1 FL=1